MSTTWINTEAMLASLQKQMNAEMQAAAEPIIKKAVEDAERQMRKQLGAMLVSLIEQSFTMDRFGSDLRILVKQIPEKAK